LASAHGTGERASIREDRREWTANRPRPRDCYLAITGTTVSTESWWFVGSGRGVVSISEGEMA
jgi:hypothetical protein